MDLKVGEAQADGVPFVYASRSPDRLELLSVGPTGTLTQVGTYPVTSTPAELALGDMDRDGIVDVVTIQSDGNGGSISVTPHASGVVSGVPGAPPVAARTMLAQNVPNPFNPSTEIRFRLASPDDARLAVYDVRGRLVRVLRDGHFEAGEYKTAWNGMDQGGHAVGSGVYFYDLTTASGVREAKRMILLK
jgi:hypothetical protein